MVRGTRILCALGTLLPVLPLHAQKAPEMGYVFPPGGRAGSSVEVHLGGYDFTPDMQFFVHDPRVTLTVRGPLGKCIVQPPPHWIGERGRSTASPIPREVPARIDIPPEMPPGPVYWQAANANGSTATGVFVVSDGPERVEDRRGERLQRLESLPVTVSGRIGKNAEVDRYVFTASADGPITLDLMARRLGSDFHGALGVHDIGGRKVADVADTEGRDTALTFVARTGEEYTVSVFDIDYRGHRSFTYRLRFTRGPRVVAVIPAAGRRGETREVEFVGYGVATGSSGLESVTKEVSFPADPELRHFRYSLETAFGRAPALTFDLSDVPERVEPPERDASPLALNIPAAVTGTLEEASGEDRYSVEAKKDELWKISLESAAIGSHLDVALSIRDAEGKDIAASDDLPGTTDAGLEFKVPADGVYTLVVTDISGRTGTRLAVYRLAVERARPDFSLSVAQRLDLKLGEEAALEVTAIRRGGLRGPIRLAIDGLPDDVTVTDSDLELSADKGKVRLKVAGDASSLAGVFGVTGTAGETGEAKRATAAAAGNLCALRAEENRIASLLVAKIMKLPCVIRVVGKDLQRAVHRGTTYPAEIAVERGDGYDGEVVLHMAARQGRRRQGIWGPDLIVPPGVDRVLYPCFMPECLVLDRTTRMVLLGRCEVVDPRGDVRFLLAAHKYRITMVLEGALLKVYYKGGDLTVRPGESFDVPVEVGRAKKLPEAARLELVVPDELGGLLDSDPLTVSVDSNQATLTVRTVADSRLRGIYELKVRVTALEDGRWPAISEATVPVVFTPVVRSF